MWTGKNLQRTNTNYLKTMFGHFSSQALNLLFESVSNSVPGVLFEVLCCRCNFGLGGMGFKRDNTYFLSLGY